jgi:hypothetical protein
VIFSEVVNKEVRVMAENKYSTWDIGRFWQTLTYFDVIPFISNIQRIFTGDNQDKTIDFSKSTNMDTILVIGANSEVGKRIIDRLREQNYRVRAVVNNGDRVKSNTQVELWEADISLPETLTPELMKGIRTVIDCSNLRENISNQEARDISSLLELISQYIQPSTAKTIFDFTNPTTELKNAWGAVDDVVMGGVSQSDIRLRGNSAVFSGIVSTDNNGGFASVRTRNFNPPLDLSGYKGIELRVQGDGKRYKFITRCEGKWDGIAYCHSFDTIYNYPINISIPFSDLIPVFRAKTVSEAGSFDASKVYSMQLMLSKFEYDGALNPKFEPGSFGLEVEYIKAYSSQLKPQLILISPENLTHLRETELKTKGLTYNIISLEKRIDPEAIAQRCLQAL